MDTVRAGLPLAEDLPTEAFGWSAFPIDPCQAQLCGRLTRSLPVCLRWSLIVHGRCSFARGIELLEMSLRDRTVLIVLLLNYLFTP